MRCGAIAYEAALQVDAQWLAAERVQCNIGQGLRAHHAGVTGNDLDPLLRDVVDALQQRREGCAQATVENTGQGGQFGQPAGLPPQQIDLLLHQVV